MRKTKIICTLGPASHTPERIEALIQAGMDCARLNFSHGTHDDHAEVFRRVRQASERLGRPVAILQDLCGPKIRVGKMKGGKVTLEEGAEVTITTKKVIGTAARIPTEYEALPRDVQRGEPILLDDGLIKLEVLKVKKDEVKCRVVNGGVLKDRKGMNLPGSAVSQPALTEKDIADAEFGKQLGMDYVALSFVQGPEDVRALREILGDPMSGGTPIIAKIERPNAVDRLDAIIAAADGIMVARGDLGVELPPEKVPVIQKTAIERGNAFGKLVITATQMLESMTKNPRPTRAEVSDVANAVFDGSDAVMLSGETAAGDHPVASVEMMASIVMEVEASPRYRAQSNRAFLKDLPTFQNATARAAVSAASDLGIDTIVAFTETGRSAVLISEYRPEARIVAFTPVPATLRRMALTWGVMPQPIKRFGSTDEMFDAVERYLVERRICGKGEAIALVAGVPPNQRQSTNLLKLHRIRVGGPGARDGRPASRASASSRAMRTRLIAALVAAGSIPLVAFAQDGGGAASAPAARAAPAKKAAAPAKKAAAMAAPAPAPAKKTAATAKKKPAVAKKKAKPAKKAVAGKQLGVTKRHAAEKAHAGAAKSPTPAKNATAKVAPAPAPAKKKTAPKAQVTRRAATPAPAAKTPVAPIPAANPELVATARLFFQGLTSQVPAAMAELSGFPFDLDGETLRSKSNLVSRLTVLFQGKDFSRLPLYGMKTLPADAMVKQYGAPPARLGKLDLEGAWVAIADLGGHGYVAVFKKKYGRWVAVAYTD